METEPKILHIELYMEIFHSRKKEKKEIEKKKNAQTFYF